VQRGIASMVFMVDFQMRADLFSFAREEPRKREDSSGRGESPGQRGE
jgi:hypothetical protein